MLLLHLLMMLVLERVLDWVTLLARVLQLDWLLDVLWGERLDLRLVRLLVLQLD
jgi:hypothetical protein